MKLLQIDNLLDNSACTYTDISSTELDDIYTIFIRKKHAPPHYRSVDSFDPGIRKPGFQTDDHNTVSNI